ncbi:MAG: TrkA C-terminal domain-containing protein, partial [Lachnospiraceae bacterium]
VYILGIILGNQQINNKKALVHFFDGLTGLMQMLIFFMLGLLSFPSRIPEIIIPMLLIALFITLIARPIAVFLILSPFRAQFNQQLVVSWAGLRGASSIVFAIMATVSGVNMENDIFHIVFGIVLLSITIQGTLLPVVSRKLNLISEDDVLKTFNDYAEEEEVQFIRLVMKKGHPWINKAVKELRMPADLLLVLIRRKGATVVPDGDTKILEDDILVLSALVYVDDTDIKLSEIIIDENHDWCNRTIAELSLPKGMLVILINRDMCRNSKWNESKRWRCTCGESRRVIGISWYHFE